MDLSLRVVYAALPAGEFHSARLPAGNRSGGVISGLMSDTMYRFLVLPDTAGGPQLPSALLLQRTGSAGQWGRVCRSVGDGSVGL